jgi:formylglycine-generating enzyme required for sulfatase activity
MEIMTEINDELVLLPGGEFMMGSDSKGDHSPAHMVYVASFYIEKCQVTNAEYYRFCEATTHRLPEFWGMAGFISSLEYPRHPVVGVSWIDASAYALWCGRRLPTETEWEYAARGGQTGLNFPNGETLQPSDGNYNESALCGPVAVGSYPANGFGLHDMQGNVVEWVSDFYASDYYTSGCTKNPQGPETGRFNVIRGGGWHSGPYCNRVYYRNALPSNWVDFNVGFRCVKDV